MCRALGYESANNIVGMLILFVLLMGWRWLSGLPNWLNHYQWYTAGRQCICLFACVGWGRYFDAQIGR